MKSSVSIVLFFLLSAFFLTALLGALERSRKLLGMAGGCLAAVVLIIVLLTPVELPSWRLGLGGDEDQTTTTTPQAVLSTTTSTTVFFTGSTTVTPHTTLYRTVTTGVTGG